MVVDVVRDVRIQLTHWIVRQFRHVHDGVDSVKIVGRQMPDVLGQGHGCRWGAVSVEEPRTVEPGIHPQHVVSALEQDGRDDRADVALSTGDENSHAIPCRP